MSEILDSQNLAVVTLYRDQILPLLVRKRPNETDRPANSEDPG